MIWFEWISVRKYQKVNGNSSGGVRIAGKIKDDKLQWFWRGGSIKIRVKKREHYNNYEVPYKFQENILGRNRTL